MSTEHTKEGAISKRINKRPSRRTVVMGLLGIGSGVLANALDVKVSLAQFEKYKDNYDLDTFNFNSSNTEVLGVATIQTGVRKIVRGIPDFNIGIINYRYEAQTPFDPKKIVSAQNTTALLSETGTTLAITQNGRDFNQVNLQKPSTDAEMSKDGELIVLQTQDGKRLSVGKNGSVISFDQVTPKGFIDMTPAQKVAQDRSEYSFFASDGLTLNKVTLDPATRRETIEVLNIGFTRGLPHKMHGEFKLANGQSGILISTKGGDGKESLFFYNPATPNSEPRRELVNDAYYSGTPKITGAGFDEEAGITYLEVFDGTKSVTEKILPGNVRQKVERVTTRGGQVVDQSTFNRESPLALLKGKDLRGRNRNFVVWQGGKRAVQMVDGNIQLGKIVPLIDDENLYPPQQPPAQPPTTPPEKVLRQNLSLRRTVTAGEHILGIGNSAGYYNSDYDQGDYSFVAGRIDPSSNKLVFEEIKALSELGFDSAGNMLDVAPTNPNVAFIKGREKAPGDIRDRWVVTRDGFRSHKVLNLPWPPYTTGEWSRTPKPLSSDGKYLAVVPRSTNDNTWDDLHIYNLETDEIYPVFQNAGVHGLLTRMEKQPDGIYSAAAVRLGEYDSAYSFITFDPNTKRGTVTPHNLPGYNYTQYGNPLEPRSELIGANGLTHLIVSRREIVSGNDRRNYSFATWVDVIDPKANIFSRRINLHQDERGESSDYYTPASLLAFQNSRTHEWFVNYQANPDRLFSFSDPTDENASPRKVRNLGFALQQSVGWWNTISVGDRSYSLGLSARNTQDSNKYFTEFAFGDISSGRTETINWQKSLGVLAFPNSSSFK